VGSSTVQAIAGIGIRCRILITEPRVDTSSKFEPGTGGLSRGSHPFRLRYAVGIAVFQQQIIQAPDFLHRAAAEEQTGASLVVLNRGIETPCSGGFSFLDSRVRLISEVKIRIAL
jgi:hypothetical protein